MRIVRRLIRDSWNVAHIARHNVVPREVEEVCHGDHIVRETYAGRLMLIGPTAGGRMLAVVLAPEGDDGYYPVTARPADRKERTIYRMERRTNGT
jgi:uncharacterized DUF497 family protein